MKASIAILFLVVVALVVLYLIWVRIVRPAAAAIKRRRLADDPWTVERDYDHPGFVQVQLEKPNENPILVGSPIPTSLAHWDFQEQIVEYELEAAGKATSLNRPALKE